MRVHFGGPFFDPPPSFRFASGDEFLVEKKFQLRGLKLSISAISDSIFVISVSVISGQKSIPIAKYTSGEPLNIPFISQATSKRKKYPSRVLRAPKP